MEWPPETWRAAVCVDSPNISRAVRRSLDDLGWDYERDRSQHHFTKLVFFITLPQMSYVFQFLVRSPIEIVVNCYDERPSYAGDIHYIEIKGITEGNAPRVRKFLNVFARQLGKKPYEIDWKERFRAGLLSRPHLVARRDWSRWGI